MASSTVSSRTFAALIASTLAIAGTAFAQTNGAGGATRDAGLLVPETETSAAVSGHRSNIAKMFRRITTEFKDNKLEDVMKFLEDYTGATLEVHWSDTADGGEGLNREQMINLKIKNMTALNVLERVLAKAATDPIAGGNTWQMTEYGTIEVGPKSALNRTKRTELYDIHDLLLEIPRYDQVPQIDLQSLLQQSQQGGGGGGQSPFQNDQDQQNREDRISLEEKGQDIIRLITSLVEPEEWVDGGGEGGTIRYYNGNILVNAPDYMHRQINGYTYWPSHTSRVVGDRRYVSLNMDNSIGTIDGFTQYPVSAVVGGKVISSDPGGSKAPAPGNKPGQPGGTKTTPVKPDGKARPAATSPAAPAPAPKPGTRTTPAKDSKQDKDGKDVKSPAKPVSPK